MMAPVRCLGAWMHDPKCGEIIDFVLSRKMPYAFSQNMPSDWRKRKPGYFASICFTPKIAVTDSSPPFPWSPSTPTLLLFASVFSLSEEPLIDAGCWLNIVGGLFNREEMVELMRSRIPTPPRLFLFPLFFNVRWSKGNRANAFVNQNATALLLSFAFLLSEFSNAPRMRSNKDVLSNENAFHFSKHLNTITASAGDPSGVAKISCAFSWPRGLPSMKLFAVMWNRVHPYP